MKKLKYLPMPLLLWLFSWVMVAHAQVAAPKCETYFRSSFENNFCPPQSQCLVADNVNHTFYTQQNADYYFWSFGDGSTAIDSIGKISHAYFKPGTFEVSVIAYYNTKTQQACKAIFTESIEVKFYTGIGSNTCLADLQTATSGLNLKGWDALQSKNIKDASRTICFWNFGDGNKSVGSNNDTIITHNYKKSGKYLLKMTKLVLVPYKSSEACTASITFDSISIKTSCFQNEICRETYTKWVTIEAQDTDIPNCNINANIVSKGNDINFNTQYAWYSDTLIKIQPQPFPLPKPIYNKYKNYNYWSFGDGSDTVALSGVHTYKKPGKYLVILHSAQFQIVPTLIACQALIYDSILHTGRSCNEMLTCRSQDSVWVEVGPDVYPSCYAKANINVTNKSMTYNSNPFWWCGTTDTKDKSTVQLSSPADPKTINYWSFGDGKDTIALSGTHTYAKPGKYLVVLHSAQYKSIQEFVFCYEDRFDSFVNSKIPCYYRLGCRSIDSVWVEIGKNPINKCLAITSSGMDITADIQLVYTADFKPGQFRHRYYNFGDGRDTMGVNLATHTYKKDGKYLVTGTEVTYYSAPPEVLAYTSFAPCTVPFYSDPSVRLKHSDCNLLEISRFSCSEWVTVDTEKLMTSVYPNPANEFGNLHLENALEKVDFIVYNAAGMLVKKIENVLNGTQQFDTSNMATGLYLYTISRDGKILKRDKFAVNR